MPPRPKPDEPTKTAGTSKRRFQVIVGCDYGHGYKAPGTIVDDVPADSVAQSLAEGVLVPEGEDLPEGVVPIPQQASYTTVNAPRPAEPAPEQED